MGDDDVDELEDEDEEEVEEDGDDEEEDEEEEEDNESDQRKNLLLFACSGVLIFFILTDPSGAAKLGRSLGGFIGDQAEALVEFLDAAFSDPTESNS